MTNLDEIANLLGNQMRDTGSGIDNSKKKSRKNPEHVKDDSKDKIAEAENKENIEERIVEEKSEIEEEIEEQSEDEEQKELEDIEKDYVDPLSEDYKRIKNNLIGKKILG